MIHNVPILLNLDSANHPVKRFWYNVALQHLGVDDPVDALSAYAVAEESITTFIESPRRRSSNPAHTVFDGLGWVGNQWRQVTCGRTSSEFTLWIQEIGQFAIEDTGDRIDYYPGACLPNTTSRVEAALGPALILALALHGIWTLHASAVELDGRAIAFVGNSGSGKSTLADYLHHDRESSFERIADDILPVALAADGVEALPRYPQLKFAPSEQPSHGKAERMPLAAVYILRKSASPDISPHIRPLQPSQASLVLIQNTVAGRVFDRTLLARHLDFCAGATRFVRIGELVYPHERQTLCKVRDTLLQDLARLS